MLLFRDQSGRSMVRELVVQKQKLRYLGHLKRSEGLGKIILEGKIVEKREGGRPRSQWEKDIRDTFDRSIVGHLTDVVSGRRSVEDVTSTRISSK